MLPTSDQGPGGHSHELATRLQKPNEVYFHHDLLSTYKTAGIELGDTKMNGTWGPGGNQMVKQVTITQ